LIFLCALAIAREGADGRTPIDLVPSQIQARPELKPFPAEQKCCFLAGSAKRRDLSGQPGSFGWGEDAQLYLFLGFTEADAGFISRFQGTANSSKTSAPFPGPKNDQCGV
jgi:hypothetical protein